jgi:hypothetical protein
MTQFQKLLVRFNACKEAIEWAGNKTWKEVYDTCERGDWLIWLFIRTNENDKRLLVLVSAKCAEQVLHLMRDQCSINAVKVAIDYGNGEADDDQLMLVADAAYYAAVDAAISAVAAVAAYDGAAAYDAAYDTYAAIAAAKAAANAANAADAANAAADAAFYATVAADRTTARNYSLKRSADIVRQCIPFEKWNIQ